MGEGLLMGLFGGPEKINVYSRQQNDYLEGLGNVLNQQIGQGVEAYGGQITPDATANQQAAFQGGAGLFADPRGTVDPTGAINTLMSGKPAFQVDPAQREAYYQDAFVNPARQQMRDALQQVDSRYGTGFGSAGTHGAAAYRTVGDFETALSGQRAGLLWGDEQARRGAAEAGMQRMVPGAELGTRSNVALQGDRRANLGMQATLGGEERSIAGQQLGEDYNKWQTAQAYNNPWVQGYGAQLLNASPYAVGQSEGALGAITGGISSIGGLFG